jgi:hypothetical protein
MITAEKGVSKMLGLVWSGNGPGQRHADRALQQRYEFNLIVAVISKRVGGEIRQLFQKLTGQLDPAIFEACVDWYAATSQEMFQRLKAQEDEHPQLFQAIQQHVVRQAVQASAQERLAKLLTYGVISRSIQEKLEEEFESQGNS